MGGVQFVGVRFRNISIPRGAVIHAAWLQFQADRAETVTSSLLIRGQASDNANAFTSSYFNLSSRPRTAASVPWAPPPWLVAGESSMAQRTPDLTGIVQEIVNRAGWTSGNAMVFLISGSGARFAESFEGGAFAAPRLRIEYTEP